MSKPQIREARSDDPPCPCGKAARAVLIRGMGEVPTCQTQDEYETATDRAYRLATLALLHGSGQSGAR